MQHPDREGEDTAVGLDQFCGVLCDGPCRGPVGLGCVPPRRPSSRYCAHPSPAPCHITCTEGAAHRPRSVAQQATSSLSVGDGSLLQSLDTLRSMCASLHSSPEHHGPVRVHARLVIHRDGHLHMQLASIEATDLHDSSHDGTSNMGSTASILHLVLHEPVA